MEALEPIEYKDPKEKDFAYSWVNSSVFLFYLQGFLYRSFYSWWQFWFMGAPLQGQARSKCAGQHALHPTV